MKSQLVRPSIIVLLLLGVILLFGCSSTTPDSKVGGDIFNRPVLTTGDSWKIQSLSYDTTYVLSLLVTGEDEEEGRGCYVLEGTYTPPMVGIFDRMAMRVDKSTGFVLHISSNKVIDGTTFTGETVAKYNLPAEPYYPLEVGKEYHITETLTSTITAAGQTKSEVESGNYVIKVEAVEQVNVAAGTFKCFRIVKYDEAGIAVGTKWVSPDTKCFAVKSIDHKTGEVTELLSYSVTPHVY